MSRTATRWITFAAVLLMAATTAQADLDRSSSNLLLDAGSIDTSGGQFTTTAAWDVNTGFQISLLGEVASPPNDVWNLNHYNPGGTTYDWTHYNFADYPYYHLQISTAKTIPASFYTGGATGEMLEWALYYTDTSGNIQTVLGGIVEDASIDGGGTFSAYLKVTPASVYRTFDGTGEGFVNTVEIFGGEGMPTDLIGYQISQAGSVVGTTWTSSGAMTLTAKVMGDMGLVRLCQRLVATQNRDGGWDWVLDNGDPDDASPLNTVGPIAKGQAMAYLVTGDPDVQAALVKAGSLLLSKTNNFSPSDGYLAAQLDAVLGGTTYTDHVVANFYDPLAAGTYDKNGGGIPYDTAGYVALIRSSRESQGIANLAAWDVAMGLVGAASCGADTTAWVAGVKAEIDELDGDEYYDVIGLAGAVYALAFVGEDYDPTAGEHEAASNLGELADILAGYQINGGGFAWNSNYVIPDDYNETIQETAYAVLALDAVDRGKFRSAIKGASAYMLSVQLETGGWENYVGSTSGENNEVSAEAAWGICVAEQSEATLTLNVSSAPQVLYVQPVSVNPAATVVVNLDVSDLLIEVKACQAIMGYDSSYLNCLTAAAGGAGVWDDLIYETHAVAGEIDTAVGVKGSSTSGTMDDSRVAILTLEPLLEGTTSVVFRDDVDDIESTFLSDMFAQVVWPTKFNSLDIVIDGTDPLISITSAMQDGQELIGTGVNAVQGPVIITVTASDALAGLDGVPVVEVHDSDGFPMAVSAVTETSPGVFTCTATVGSSTANGLATIDAEVSDKAGNLANDAATFNVNKNRVTGNIELEGIVDAASREVVFVAKGGTEKQWTLTVDGFVGHVAAYALDDVPAGTTTLSAKTAWNLRSRVAVSLDGNGQAVADLVGADKLPGGDLNGTNSINVLDYTIMRTHWYQGSAGEMYDPADVDASGLVNLVDYTILKGNWFTVGDEE